ncbi:MAG: adenylate/guanylate cyclase domain-containing protein [Planctomycetota bacterium]
MAPSKADVWNFGHRHALFLVLLSPLFANVIASVFNILYNQTQIERLLSKAQMDRFYQVVLWFNLVVYPIAVACFIYGAFRLRAVHRALIAGESVESDALLLARRRVVNLPWWFLTIASLGWLICIPVFPIAIASVGEPISKTIVFHLITSFLIASLIAVTHSFFAVELTIQKTMFPVFFQDVSPARIENTLPLGIRGRGLLWTFSAVVGPVVSLLLILLVPDATNQAPLFAMAVGLVAISFAFVTTALLSRLVVTPIKKLKDAAFQVADGDLSVQVNVQRADEIGQLVDSFNTMVEGLKQRETLEQTFGRHVGHEAARQILREGDYGAGREQTISVMFVDVRNFTSHSSHHAPENVIAALNVFFEAAVDAVEHHQGMINKFLGDGFMALFGVGDENLQHADHAVRAAVELREFVRSSQDLFSRMDWEGFSIGIGINTGPAIVGSIGSPRRQEYTAMGDTVNTAARVEGLSKNSELNRLARAERPADVSIDASLLITETTRQSLVDDFECIALPPQSVKGKESIHIHAVSG